MMKKIGTGLMVVVLLLTLAAGAFAAKRTDYAYVFDDSNYNYRYKITTVGPVVNSGEKTTVVYTKKNTSDKPVKMTVSKIATSTWRTNLGYRIKRDWIKPFPSQYGSKESLPINFSVTVPAKKTLRVTVRLKTQQWRWEHYSQEQKSLYLNGSWSDTSVRAGYASTVTHEWPVAYQYKIN